MEPEAGSEFNSGQLMMIAAICIVLLCGIGYYWWAYSVAPTLSPEEEQALEAAEQRILASISASSITVPIDDVIPVIAPVSNPVANMYRNPFE